MTESEWLTCAEPQRMLTTLIAQRLVSERKLRLFAAAMWARHPDILADLHASELPDVAARYADGEISWEEVRKLRRVISDEIRGFGVVDYQAYVRQAARHLARNLVATEQRAAEDGAQADLLRDLFGNPFREVIRYSWDRNIRPRPDNKAIHFRAEWLTWQNGTISRMAQQIYDARDFAALPVLADALSDAGCQEEAILRHCRGQEPCQPCNGLGYVLPRRTFCYACNSTGFLTSPHVRGCWCVDLILGKV